MSETIVNIGRQILYTKTQYFLTVKKRETQRNYRNLISDTIQAYKDSKNRRSTEVKTMWYELFGKIY